jgi:hypothetical protein
MRPPLKNLMRAGAMLLAFGATGDATMAAASKRLGGAQASAVVTMNIYSGRPDPNWTLADGELATLLARIDAAPEASGKSAPATAVLGYRGLSVTFSGGAQVEIAAGRIEIGGGPALRDDARALERWLVETGRERIDGKAVESALARLDKAK